MNLKARYRVVLVNGTVLWVHHAAWDYAGVTVSGRVANGTSWALPTATQQDLPAPESTLYPWPAVRQVDDYRNAFERQERERDLEEADQLEHDVIENATGQGRR